MFVVLLFGGCVWGESLCVGFGCGCGVGVGLIAVEGWFWVVV